MTATESDTEAAFWKAIGEFPADGLRRLVFADWLEERDEPGGVCQRCDGHGLLGDDGSGSSEGVTCESCRGFGEWVSNGYAATAAGLRATADRVPHKDYAGLWAWFTGINMFTDHPESDIERDVFDRLTSQDGDNNEMQFWLDYPTAEAAIRDLVRAWVEVSAGGAK